ncbi:hypothetical protein BKA93DRAFT_758909 [Sparassis latifolia]|uniref:Uncharacterized protein n=1 Tax=Sparassis crispa TaxID=139825 RepID=A0A401GCB8_9APHY|nr:hypothetical protein SCP_0210150 [Sparassis crispa]GBE79814.1 hypothetical protein SCP_0210150 [Sparassis crispa]
MPVATTPTKQKTPSKQPVRQAEGTAKKGSPRKSPRCVHCGRPRQGHQRSGCPNVNPPIPTSEPKGIEAELVDNLGLLHISPTIANANDKEKRRRRSSANHNPQLNISVASLSPTSSEVVRQLGKPGAMAALSASEEERHTASAAIITRKNSDEHRSTPLVRTATEIGREECLRNLEVKSKAKPANVFPLAVNEITDMQKYAEGSGFRTRVIMPGKGAVGTHIAFLVVGRDGQAVDELFDMVRVETKKKSSAGSLLTVGGAGALAGAIATFAGLAYAP